MKNFAKAIGVFINLCTYGAGIAVLLIKLLKKEFYAVFVISGFSYDESLFFNLALFTLGSALLGVVLTMFIAEYVPEKVTVEYPIIWAILPAAISLYFTYAGITGGTVREKAIVIITALIYVCASAVNIYSGAKMFTLFPNKSGKSDNEQ